MSKQIFMTCVQTDGSAGYASVGAGTQLDGGLTGYVVPQTNEGDVVVHMPGAGTCSNLTLLASSGTPGAGNTITVTVRKTMSTDTAVVATVSDAETTADSGSNSFTFSKGDIITLSFSGTGTPSTCIYGITLEMDYDDDVSVVTGGMMSRAVQFYAPWGMYGSYYTTTPATIDVDAYMPFGFTVTGIYVYCRVAPGAGASRGIGLGGVGVFSVSDTKPSGSRRNLPNQSALSLG